MATTSGLAGLRERKKREMRQLISDTATSMFLARGFDTVTVAEIAAACGVSEKTVFNYFPTKEGLLLDREAAMAEGIRAALGPATVENSPIEAIQTLLAQDLENSLATWREISVAAGLAGLLRFTSLVDATPSLRAAQRDMMMRLVQVAAVAMAERAGIDPESPEPQIAAHALISLWGIQFAALKRAGREGVTQVDALREAVSSDVQRAARLIDTGLWSFSLMVQGSTSRAQFETAAGLAARHSKQVAAALRDAKRAWRAMRDEMRTASR